MRRHVARQALQAALVVLLVATLTFVLIHLAPGDPFSGALDNPLIPAATRQHWRAAYGFDRPVAEQYLRYLAAVAKGDFGYSVSLRRPVADALAAAIPNTLLLLSVAMLAAFGTGVFAGAVQAARHGSAADRLLGGATLVLYSVPEFWLALVVLLVFAYRLALFPVGGTADPLLHDFMSPAERFADTLRHLVLPALTLSLPAASAIARYQRAALLQISHEDFLRTARAKGVPERTVLFRHALRNAILPTITLFGLTFPVLLGGAVFVEKVFAWPGMGWLAVNAIATRDYPLVVGSVVLGAAMTVAGSLLADTLATAADPRLRHRG